MIWHFVWFFRACAEPLIMIGWPLLGIHPQEAVQTVRPYYLQNTQHFGWAGITAIPLRSIFSSQYIVHIKCVSSAPKGTFLWGEIYSLPYSLLLDYSTLRSLPYPTLPEVEKPLLVGAWRGVPWSKYVVKICGRVKMPKNTEVTDGDTLGRWRRH